MSTAIPLTPAALRLKALWTPGLMLMALHGALAWGIGTLWSQALLLTHFGLFLLWQPVWRSEREVKPLDAALIVGSALLLVLVESWWLMAFWLALLFGLIGGSALGVRDRRQRLVALLGAVYLLAMLLIWVVPHLFEPPDITVGMTGGARWGLALLPPLMLALRAEPKSVQAPLAVDLFYSLVLFLLVAALVLGSFVVKMRSQGDYALALAQTLFVIALALVFLSWLWNPRGGFAGVGQLVSRYLLSMGLPFERWMRSLADLAERENQPGRFLQLALADMAALPWMAGIEWQTPNANGALGGRSPYRAEFTFRDLTLALYTRTAPSPALLLHLKLLAQLLGHFYDAKRREELERHNAYTEAIFNTGARLTHDVKNLLQSLRSLCTAAESADDSQAAALQALMRRQLPQIAERLQNTLEKLKAPTLGTGEPITAASWWESLRGRYPQDDIRFVPEDNLVGMRVPGELFDSVADNLLQNALRKAKHEPGIAIEIFLAPGPALWVCDTGAAIDPARAVALFEAPVESSTGLGIGLFQAGRQARQLGYRLYLAENRPGRVCFCLAPAQGS